MINTAQFWMSEGERHIIPNGTVNPEGFDPGEMISRITGNWFVTEVGCGVGRLSEAFASDKYLGLDINPRAIDIARKDHPEYEFRQMSVNGSIPPTDVVLLYTVALHISDGEIWQFLSQACRAAQQRIIIAEIMDRRWRREGNPPVFNRDPGDYIGLMGSMGWALIGREAKQYAHYANHWAYQQMSKSTDVTVLTFAKPQDPGRGNRVVNA